MQIPLASLSLSLSVSASMRSKVFGEVSCMHFARVCPQPIVICCYSFCTGGGGGGGCSGGGIGERARRWWYEKGLHWRRDEVDEDLAWVFLLSQRFQGWNRLQEALAPPSIISFPRHCAYCMHRFFPRYLMDSRWC